MEQGIYYIYIDRTKNKTFLMFIPLLYAAHNVQCTCIRFNYCKKKIPLLSISTLFSGFSIKETVKILCLNSNFLNSFQTAVSNLGSSESCKDVPGKKVSGKKTWK